MAVRMSQMKIAHQKFIFRSDPLRALVTKLTNGARPSRTANRLGHGKVRYTLATAVAVSELAHPVELRQ